MATPIRHKVFIMEQHVPNELEWDGMDDTARHTIAITHDDHVIGCARLLSTGQIGRMAVLPAYRNMGVGTELLSEMEKEAIQRGMRSVFLHAQTSALPFYIRHGYDEEGEIFYEADIPHKLMRKQLETGVK
ncbi:MAG: GNAT family N-acetyltransferase [Gammaproteobacteria bacterium]|nr:MAG: GNAT family N-acetyltransferase [Gammaproteobacteria bacterium]